MDFIYSLIRLRGIIGLLMLFCMLGFASWRELEYGLWGETARGTVTGIEPGVRYRTGRMPGYYFINFEYTDASGAPRTGREPMSLSVPQPAIGEPVNIQYCPSPIAIARLEGHSQFIYVYMFLGMLTIGAAVLFIYRFWQRVMTKEFSTVPSLADLHPSSQQRDR
jgi:hypothetical protein